MQGTEGDDSESESSALIQHQDDIAGVTNFKTLYQANRIKNTRS